MQCPSPLTKLSTELRCIRRLKITRPDASKPARLHEFLPRSTPRTTMYIGPLLYLSKGQRSYADRCKRAGHPIITSDSSDSTLCGSSLRCRCWKFEHVARRTFGNLCDQARAVFRPWPTLCRCECVEAHLVKGFAIVRAPAQCVSERRRICSRYN